MPVRNGEADLKKRYGVEMTRPGGKKFMVYTCRDWEKAQAGQAYSATTCDAVLEGFLIHTCGWLASTRSRGSDECNPRKVEPNGSPDALDFHRSDHVSIRRWRAS